MTETRPNQLLIEALGGLRISRNGQPITGFYSRKAQALLIYLAISNRPHARASLAALFWGESPESYARASLRQALSNLRGLVGDHLTTNRQTASIIPETVQIDVHDFEAQLRDLASRTISTQQIERALSFYHGDFLEGTPLGDAPEFDIWVSGQRERLRDLAIKALQMLASQQIATRDDISAISTFQQLLSLDPWRESAHRQLMELLARNGQRTAALTQFQTCRKILADELGVDPEPSTIAAYERIKTGDREGRDPVPTRTPDPGVRPLSPPQTSFIGRQSEIDRITDLLTDPACRLITLVGPGGSGKTRLALQIMEDQQTNFADGARVVPLASASAADQQISVLASVLDITPDPSDSTRQRILATLRDREMLLVIDNGDHLHENVPLLTSILTDAPGIKMLVTSRERLAVQTEWLVPVDGLDCVITNDPLEIPAVQLFIERARRIQPNLDQSAENLSQIARICQLVGGLPLAIEIAASWTRTHSTQEIADRIAHDLDFLATTTRDFPARHRSLRAVFDQSWAQLTEHEQDIYRSLAVFQESFNQPAAFAVAGASPLDLMSLVDKSLLRRDPSGAYRMHEFAQQYALEHLNQRSDEAKAVRHRHAAHFTQILEQSGPRLREFHQIETLQTLQSNIANIRAAWSWIIEHREVELASHALDGLCLFLEMRAWNHEGLTLVQTAARTFASTTDLQQQILRGRLLGWQGRFHHFLGQFPQSEALTNQSHELLRQHNAEHHLAFYLSTLGRNANVLGRNNEARELQQAALAEAQATGDRYAMGLAYKHLGDIAYRTSNYTDADHWFRESLDVRREIGDWTGVAEDYGNLGSVAVIRGDYAQAEQLIQQCIDLYRELGREIRCTYPLTDLAEVYCSQGHYAKAQQILEECLEIAERAIDQRAIAVTLRGLAKSARLQGDLERAESLAQRSLGYSRLNNHYGAAARTLATLATIAMDQHKPHQAERFAKESLANAWKIEDPLAISMARTILGQRAISQHSYNEATQELATAFETIRTTGARPALLEVLHTMAHLWLPHANPDATADPAPAFGADHHTANPERSAALLHYVINDPATWHETRQHAQRTLDTLANHLPASALSAAADQATNLPLDHLATLLTTH